MRRIFFWLLWGVFLLTSCVSLREAESAAEPERKSEVRPAEAAVNWDGNLTPAVPDAENEPAEPVELDDPYADVDVTFLGVGDLLVHPNIYMDAGFRGYEGKTYDFLPMFSDVADFFADADIAFVNQVTVMAGEKYGYSGYPCFNAPQQLGMDLCTLGVDIVNIANNHMLDMGTAGLADTIAFWKTQPTLMVGAYDDEEDAATLRILERDCITIAVLAYTFGTNGLVKSASSPIVIPYLDDERILSDLEAAREAADFVLVSVHWGIENTFTPTDEQRRLAILFAENGADAIIGHHSHCLQPIEWIETERGRVICVYSLGNFLSGMAWPMNQVGGMFTFHIVGDGNGGLCVADPVFLPTVFYYGMDWFDTHIYLLDNYTDEIAAKHGVGMTGATLRPDEARQMVTDVIADEFLRLS